MLKNDIVIDIIKKVINENKIDINSKSNQFKRWDSLANVNIALELEKKFNIKIKASDMENMNSVKDILNVLNAI